MATTIGITKETRARIIRETSSTTGLVQRRTLPPLMKKKMRTLSGVTSTLRRRLETSLAVRFQMRLSSDKTWRSRESASEVMLVVKSSTRRMSLMPCSKKPHRLLRRKRSALEIKQLRKSLSTSLLRLMMRKAQRARTSQVLRQSTRSQRRCPKTSKIASQTSRLSIRRSCVRRC